MQDRTTDRYQRYIGLQIEKYECEVVIAAPVPSLRSGFVDMSPGWYYVATVRAMCGGVPLGNRGSCAQFFATDEEREKYIAKRLKAYNKRVNPK